MTAQVEPLGGYVLMLFAHASVHVNFFTVSASGVGESIVQYVEKTNQDMLVLGSRGMGAVKRCAI